MVALIGPDANQFVLMDKDGNFSNRMGWRDRLGVLFKDGLMIRDFADHRLNKEL